MNKLKIAIISFLHHSISEPFKGGTESFTHSLAKALITRGHEVVVFSAKGTDKEINPYIMGDPEQDFNKDNAYKKIMTDILPNSDFDIVHNNALSGIPIELSNMIPMPMITTLHSPYFATYDYAFNRIDNKNNTFVTVSNSIQKLWSPALANRVIPNGVNLEKFKPLLDEKKENYAIWFGRITPEKGTIYAIRAANKAGIPLKIAGRIYDTEYFENRIKPLIKKNIEYIGPLSHLELCKVIAKAKASIFIPEPNESYGLVVAESLACGTPVAAFNLGPVCEIIDEKSGALAQPRQKGIFGGLKAIKNLSNALLKATKLNSQDCRKRAQQVADINIMIDKYEKLYYEVIASRNMGKKHRISELDTRII